MSYVELLRAVAEQKDRKYRRAAEVHELVRRRRESRLASLPTPLPE